MDGSGCREAKASGWKVEINAGALIAFVGTVMILAFLLFCAPTAQGKPPVNVDGKTRCECVGCECENTGLCICGAYCDCENCPAKKGEQFKEISFTRTPNGTAQLVEVKTVSGRVLTCSKCFANTTLYVNGQVVTPDELFEWSAVTVDTFVRYDRCFANPTLYGCCGGTSLRFYGTTRAANAVKGADGKWTQGARTARPASQPTAPIFAPILLPSGGGGCSGGQCYRR